MTAGQVKHYARRIHGKEIVFAFLLQGRIDVAESKGGSFLIMLSVVRLLSWRGDQASLRTDVRLPKVPEGAETGASAMRKGKGEERMNGGEFLVYTFACNPLASGSDISSSAYSIPDNTFPPSHIKRHQSVSRPDKEAIHSKVH